MSVPLAVEGMDAIALAQEGERLCRENNMKAGIRFLEMALEKKVNLGGRSIETVSAIYSQLGNAYFALRDFHKALEYHQYDLQTAALIDDASGLAKASGNIGNTYKALGDYDNAYNHALKHLKLAKELNDTESEAKALYNIGSIYHCRAKTRLRSIASTQDCSTLKLSVPSDLSINADLQAAVGCYSKNLEIVEGTEDLAACGRTYGNIGNTYYMLGDYETAVVYHNKRLEIARQFGDRAAMKRAYTNLGNAHIFLNQAAKALEYYRLALSMATELRDEVSEAQCCFSLGSGAAISGDFTTAAEFHTRHLKLARKLGDRCGEARACAALAEDYVALGESKKALYFYALSALIAAEMGDQSSEASTRTAMSDLLREMEGEGSIDNQHNNLSYVLDSSADPCPQSMKRLSISMQSLLLGEHSDCGLSRRGVAMSNSTSSINETVQRNSVVHLEDDFIDMLSRMQSKRINDQRCDPVVLNDLTNRSKGMSRQSDSVICEGTEDMLDLIESLQGRRMEEQRAHLSVNAETVSVSGISTQQSKDDVDEVLKTERSRSEDAHSLYEMLIQSQADRLEEQRSELPSTMPDEDIKHIVMTMQRGRMDAQRAHLNPPDE